MKTMVVRVPDDNGAMKLRVEWIDTKKNLEYAAKRKRLGDEMTEKLGVTCWG